MALHAQRSSTRQWDRAPGRIYALADAALLGVDAVPDAVEALADAGIGWIQIRAKRVADADLFDLVESCFHRLDARTGTQLWMDDRADVAALFPFAGLHLGQFDLPPEAARRVVGPQMRIGLSTHNEEELERGASDPEVDVLAVGPVFSTTGKADPDPVVGTSFVHRARRRTDKPLVAIGGLGLDNLAEVLAAGADAVAVMGAICRGDVRTNALRLSRLAESSQSVSLDGGQVRGRGGA